MREYCFAREEAFYELKNLYELETGCTLPRMMSVILSDYP